MQRHRNLTSAVIVALMMAAPLHGADIRDFAATPHLYWQRPPQDRFTHLYKKIQDGSVKLDAASANAYLASLLRALEIPVTSQLLVFSVTSLQSSLISPANPRALYFNEDTYVGYVPGGRIEIASFDPQLGGIFYIFDVPLGSQAPAADRSQRCFNCHAGSFSHHVPALFVESVIPGDNGGPLDAYRRDSNGHGVPFAERLGGWHVTGAPQSWPHHGNTLGNYFQGQLTTRPNPPGAQFDLKKYLVPTSDILPHLLHEHQVGFTNRVVEAVYQTRARLDASQNKLTPADVTALDELASGLVRYVLFADEAPLPAPVKGDADFMKVFLQNRRAALGGASLRDFDLRDRLFKNRCSYMIDSSLWDGMPPLLKQSLYAKMWSALQDDTHDPVSAHLPAPERRAIRQIIKETKPGLPGWWK